MAGIIDLRSDTVTQPTQVIRELMASAVTGDDVYGEDPTVNQLEQFAAQLLNKEAAIFCPSGTQSNLIGLLAHCGRGDEYIVGSAAHTYLYEGGGAAVLGSIQPQPLNLNTDATFDLQALESAIKPADIHYARTRLICLENTHNGRCLPQGYTSKVKAIADKYGLAMHLDGARLFNAVVSDNSTAAKLSEDFDSVSICLSKGLGAPVGSLLVGSEALINEARHWRKMLGGGMRQAGILAAAGLYALQHHVERLNDDHQRASQLGKALGNIDGVTLKFDQAFTNMVYVQVSAEMKASLDKLAPAHNVILPSGEQMRLVTHLDVDDEDIDTIVKLFEKAAQ
ncbi:low-specificity L-threonine aldolase [Thalassotalea litorea]|uniref:low-specificity L-threonine aldolase n=1 Tax=Thalassotalea litorea TaxID=2020715 RepID=UPI0037363721